MLHELNLIGLAWNLGGVMHNSKTWQSLPDVFIYAHAGIYIWHTKLVCCDAIVLQMQSLNTVLSDRQPAI